MSIQTRPDPEEPPSLSRERVLDMAIVIADEGGIDALSMRNLARRLDVGVMSLYYYVANKDALLEGMVDMVLREADLSPNGTDWKTSIRRVAVSTYEVLHAHPWAAELMFTAGGGPTRLRYMEVLLATLREAGFSADVTHRAYHALDSHIIGFTLWQASISVPADLVSMANAFLDELSVDEFPYLAEHIRQHIAESSTEGESAFEFGLDLILDGLERMPSRD